MSFGQAGKLMCEAVAQRAQLQTAKRVLDVGFGYGAQLPLFLEACPNDAEIFGVNISKAQVTHARSMLNDRGIDRVCVYEGSATDLSAISGLGNLRRPASFDRIIAMDCAYFFTPSREVFFCQAFERLKPGGLLVCADIVATSHALAGRGWRLPLISCICGIPRANLGYDISGYCYRLQDVGFFVESVELQTTAVFGGFVKFVRRQHERFRHITLPGAWWTYTQTARFCEWALHARYLYL